MDVDDLLSCIKLHQAAPRENSKQMQPVSMASPLNNITLLLTCDLKDFGSKVAQGDPSFSSRAGQN
jgi:hypothetical protein